MGGVIFWIIGAPLGLLYGAANGHKNINVLNEEIQPYTNNKLKKEIEPSVLQADGFYKVNVSLAKYDRDLILVKWQGKEIWLGKLQVKQIRKIDNRIYIIISQELYKSKFLRNN